MWKIIPSENGPLCLNPCSNGMRIEQKREKIIQTYHIRLNPCSNGMRIELKLDALKKLQEIVLILVLMECG